MPIASESLGFLLADVSKLMRRRFEKNLEDKALTLSQARALLQVARNEGCRQVDLSDQLELKQATLARLIDQLELAGLVKRQPDPEDRRAYRLYLQARAKQVLCEIEKVAALTRAQALGEMPAQESAAFASALHKMRHNLSSR